MFNIGSAELAVLLAFTVVPIWALVDIASRDAAAFDAVGQSRTTWIVLQVVGILCCQIGGLVWGLVYLFRVRPRLARAR